MKVGHLCNTLDCLFVKKSILTRSKSVKKTMKNCERNENCKSNKDMESREQLFELTGSRKKIMCSHNM